MQNNRKTVHSRPIGRNLPASAQRGLAHCTGSFEFAEAGVIQFMPLNTKLALWGRSVSVGSADVIGWSTQSTATWDLSHSALR
jgi:hypothetical protein